MHLLDLACLTLLGTAPLGVAAALTLRNDNDLMNIINSANFSQGTVISYPGSTEFENATIRWEAYFPPTYSAAISPATEEDVVKAMNLLRSNNLSYLATGGRHGYRATFATLRDGVALDLAQLNKVSIDSDARTLTVGPGVHFADIFDPVYNAGFVVQTGSCSCVGVIGATLGAGIGRLNGVYGLIIDALESVRLVTANGDIIEASETINPELFWGIRGAGFNFGVVLSATYRLQPRGSYLAADLIFSASMNESFFKALSHWKLPPEQTVQTTIAWNDTIGEPQFLVSTAYFGSESAGRQGLSPLLSLNPIFQNIREIPWNRLSFDGNFGSDAAVCVREQLFDIYPINLRTFDVPTMKTVFEKLVGFYAQTPLARASAITMETFANQAAVAVPDEETAYPWRDTETYVMLQMRWTDINDSTTAAAANAKARELRDDLAATSGYDGLAAYINYAKGDETLESLYGERKLPRLAALKKQYDPSNVFGFNVPLPTAYP